MQVITKISSHWNHSQWVDIRSSAGHACNAVLHVTLRGIKDLHQQKMEHSQQAHNWRSSSIVVVSIQLYPHKPLCQHNRNLYIYQGLNESKLPSMSPAKIISSLSYFPSAAMLTRPFHQSNLFDHSCVVHLERTPLPHTPNLDLTEGLQQPPRVGDGAYSQCGNRAATAHHTGDEHQPLPKLYRST
jgi:hypothetical protein